MAIFDWNDFIGKVHRKGSLKGIILHVFGKTKVFDIKGELLKTFVRLNKNISKQIFHLQ